jgi:hypothetical protein
MSQQLNTISLKLNALKDVYIQFNYWFFDDKLPDPNFALTGHKNSFVSDIAPGHYLVNLAVDKMNNTPRALCRDLVHQMVHIWQHWVDYSNGRPGYHNKQFQAKMKEIGIECSTGQIIDMLDIEQGDFEIQLPMLDRNTWEVLGYTVQIPEKKHNAKLAHVCPCDDGHTIYGPEGLDVICGKCRKPYVRKRQ